MQPIASTAQHHAEFQFADEIAGLEFQFDEENIEYHEFEGGRRFFTAAGVIKNTSDQTLKVLPLVFAFKDKREKIVFLHEVALTHGNIPAHEIMEVNAYIIGIPKTAENVEIGWKAAGDGGAVRNPQGE